MSLLPIPPSALTAAIISSAGGATERALNGQLVPLGSMAKWQSALAKVEAGTARAKVLYLGDSTDAGTGAGVAGAALRSASCPTKVAAILNAAGVNAQVNSFWGTNQLQLTADYDPRLVRGTGWASSGATAYSLGGPTWQCASPNIGSLAFTISDNTDSADIYYLRSSGLGTFTVNIDGGLPLATIDANGATALVKTTVTFAPGTAHTLNIQRLAGGTVYVDAVTMFDSTVPAVEISNAGWAGALTADIASTTNAWSSGNAVSVVAPDLTFINCLINPWTLVAGTPQESIALAMANIQILITKAIVSGSVCLIGPIPSSTVKNTVAGQQAYISALYDLAVSNGVAFVDRTRSFIDFATASAAGLMADTVHGNSPGYSLCARQQAELLLRPV